MTELSKAHDCIFTVVIPTVDRATTLVDTIRTCLAQEDDKLRIIVSDNASADDTAEVVRTFSDARLSYVNPGRRLGMAEHWEFAVAHAKSGYVTVLGDDDGLLPGAVSLVREILTNYDAKAVSWQKVEYHWPDHIVPSFRNWLQIPLAAEITRLNATDVVKDVVAFREGYRKLPCIYNAFISTNLIQSYRLKNGGIFLGGCSPDIYSGFAIASEIQEIIFCNRPLAVNGASRKSNGTLQNVGKKEDASAKNFWAETKYTYEPGIPRGPFVELGIADAFLKVQKICARFSPDMIDKERLIESAVNATLRSHIPESRHVDRLQVLQEYARLNGLLEFFESACERCRQLGPGGGLPQPGYHEPHSIVFDATAMGVDNVYSASLRAGEILDLKAEQGALFQQLTKMPRPELAIAIFARSIGSPLRLNFDWGATCLPGYVNVDLSGSAGSVAADRPDVFCELCDMMELDFPEGTVSKVRLGNVIKDLNWVVALEQITKWRSWLVLDGELTIDRSNPVPSGFLMRAIRKSCKEKGISRTIRVIWGLALMATGVRSSLKKKSLPKIFHLERLVKS